MERQTITMSKDSFERVLEKKAKELTVGELLLIVNYRYTNELMKNYKDDNEEA